jgi:hypothetical protein
MDDPSWRRELPVALVASLLGIGGLSLWVPATEIIVHDAANYLAMARGTWSDASAPFAYRIGIPLLAGQLPLAPEATFRGVTLLSLALTLTMVYGVGRWLGQSRNALLLGLGAAVSTPGFIHHFHNPYLADAASLLALTAAVACWLAGMFGAALVIFLFAALVRETILVTAPLWAVDPPRWRVLLAAAVPMTVLLAIRLLPQMPPSPSALQAIGYVLERKGLVKIVGDALGSWHLLWLLGGLGLWLAPPERRRRLLPPTALLLLAACAFSLVALNTQRMFTFAFPMMALALAEFFSRGLRRAPGLSVALCAVLLTGIPLWFPAWPWGEALSGRPGLRVLYGVAALAVAVPLLLRCRTRASPPTAPASVQG